MSGKAARRYSPITSYAFSSTITRNYVLGLLALTAIGAITRAAAADAVHSSATRAQTHGKTHEAPPADTSATKFQIIFGIHDAVCSEILRALNHPQPPPESAEKRTFPRSGNGRREVQKLYRDRIFVPWHAIRIGPDQEYTTRFFGNKIDAPVWTLVRYMNDGVEHLVEEDRGFAETIATSPSDIGGRNWSDPRSYEKVHYFAAPPMGECEVETDPLAAPFAVQFGLRTHDGQICEPNKLIHVSPENLEHYPRWEDIVRFSLEQEVLQFASINGSIYVVNQVSSRAAADVLFGIPPGRTVTVLKFDGRNYQNECLLAAGSASTALSSRRKD